MAIPDNQFSSSPIIIYDGVCHLCNSGVNFILKRDRKKTFRFTPFQSLFAKNLLKENGESEHVGDTFILIHEGKIFNRADAALKITMLLGGKWKLFYPLYLVPKFIRNGIYNIIARNRYKWFGKEESCMMPSPEISERFIL
ncbi:MAG: DUF393 domain-containing protein [Sphingobacteriales bacterium]|nr:MAG: DUF393 domain-containing protein [Sphingobacteriales bacterium]